MAARSGALSAGERAPKASAVPPRFVVHLAGRLRGLLLRLADRLLPAPIAVVEQAHRFTAAHLLSAFAQLGIAEHLAGGPKSADQLAALVGADAHALHRALRAAAVIGIVRADRSGRFHATRLIAPLRAGDPSAAGDWCRYIGSPAVQAAWTDLEHALRTGEPAFRRVHGTDMFAWFDEHPDEGRRFSAGLGGLTRAEAPIIVATYPFPDEGVVCDVAGGTGVLLAEILRRRPRLRGVLVETPPVLSQAGAYLEAEGVADRVQLVEGDLFGAIDVRADVYLLKWILHDWDDVTGTRIVKNVAAAMPPRARLVVVEGEQERNRPHARFSMIDLQMLAVTEGGRERSSGEIERILTDAGLCPTGVRHTATDLALVEATTRGKGVGEESGVPSSEQVYEPES
jgi:hypothetical protein